MRIVLGLFGMCFAALILWAVAMGNFGQSGRFLTTDPWGIVTLSDLYLGLVLSGVIIALFERRPLRAILWCLPLPFLGNLWTVVWFVMRWPALKRTLTHAGR